MSRSRETRALATLSQWQLIGLRFRGQESGGRSQG